MLVLARTATRLNAPGSIGAVELKATGIAMSCKLFCPLARHASSVVLATTSPGSQEKRSTNAANGLAIFTPRSTGAYAPWPVGYPYAQLRAYGAAYRSSRFPVRILDDTGLPFARSPAFPTPQQAHVETVRGPGGSRETGRRGGVGGRDPAGGSVTVCRARQGCRRLHPGNSTAGIPSVRASRNLPPQYPSYPSKVARRESRGRSATTAAAICQT